MTSKEPGCTGARVLGIVSILMAGLLALGSSSAWAQSNPSTCTKTGPALLLTELRDLNNDGVGETPITGSKIAGETIYYQASLFVSTATGQCAYEGGTLCIDPPGATGCTDVTPLSGIPLLCDNDTVCDPDGVDAVDSGQLPYVVNPADFDTSGLCNNQVRAVAQYRNGTSHFGGGVFPVNADTPICNPVLFCGDGIVGNTSGETCDPPGQPGGASGNVCRGNCTVCGDGVLDAGEQCDDGNSVDTDACRNSCVIPICGDGILGNTPGETCEPPGQPGGASGNTCRGDCTVCGDGHLDAGEACDDGNNVDTDGCRNSCVLAICGDGILGNTPGETCEPPGQPGGASGNTCRGDCTVCGDGHLDSGEACDDGNNVDTDGCRNSCVLPICGDGILGNTPGETCEPPGQPGGASGNTCRGDCTVCGDGHLDSGEACDDGNATNGDGCENSCVPTPICGDSIVGNTPGETCDPPGTPAGANGNPCRGDCTVCGDGHLDSGEACDDGNSVDTDGCRNSCVLPVCGDSIVGNTPGETCDPPGTPAGPNGNPCRGDCTVCGDGHLDSGEACDDGNNVDTDGCRNSCVLPSCGDGILGNTPGETCEPPGQPGGASGNTCRADCTVCGDGHLDSGEACDDGNNVDTDGCRNSCVLPSCGDGILNAPGETCEPPGQPGGASGNTCRANCTVCGDGHLDEGESCDDGNATNGDGCENSCVPTPICGDSIVGNTPGETCDPPGQPAGASGNTCRGDCTVCGDGHLDSGEQCDDGNSVDTDGCRNSCVLPGCGDGILGNTPGETCEPPGQPGGASGNTCRANCTVCGDGHLDEGESCDDGNATNGDGCENSCVPTPICGDSIVGNTPGETCDPPGTPAGANGNTCRGNCTVCGDGHLDTGEQCDDGNTNNADACQNDCTLPLPCSVVISKTVAPDDGIGGGTACDGVADGPFVEAVTVDQTSCVVYQICVQNTGGQVLDTSGVTVSDPVLGSVNVNFGTIAPGATVCNQAPGIVTAPNCTGGSPAGTSCICQEVEGVNTATITSAICDATNENACAQSGSDCSDTANVACLGPGSCRMTGGHNFDVVDAEFDENGKVYTTGGQIGAPNESGCCELPPKGKCVAGKCTGGLNGGNACKNNDQCPNDPGRNSHCPWGDWEHNHHSGSDDSGSVTSGSFAFHSGTAAAPNEAFIKSVLCADPGWCVQARPAPFKQIFWEGTGVFRNNKDKKGNKIPLPFFGACASQPIPYSKPNGTIHYYKAHVSDFGEPAGIHQKPVDGCQKAQSCINIEPNQSVEISNCALGDVCEIEAVDDPVTTALHPLCLAQNCSECPDEYEIEIHCTADPNSPVAYRVSHEIREGNFQLHPPVGDSCNPSCGDGVCETGVTGTAETCQSCPGDCCP